MHTEKTTFPNPLRVIHVISGDLWAGAEVMVANLLMGMPNRKNIDIMTVVLNEGRLVETLRKAGLNIIVFDELKLSFFQLLKKLNAVIKNFQPQIIHSHRYKENLLSYLATRRLPNKLSLISTLHGMPEEYDRGFSFKRMIIQRSNSILLSKFFDQTIAVSHDIKSILVSKNSFSRQNINVIHNGIYLPEYEKKKNKKKFVIGTCGRLTPVKNFKFFIEIAAKISNINKKILFIIAGDGPEKNALQELCLKYNLDNTLSMPGHVDNMAAFYNNIDLFVNTSLHEGIPMSILEAMGHGVPVVATNVGGLPEIINTGVDGILIPHHNSDLFAYECIELISNKVKWESMSRSARRKIKNNFSVDSMINNYCKIYSKFPNY